MPPQELKLPSDSYIKDEQRSTSIYYEINTKSSLVRSCWRYKINWRWLKINTKSSEQSKRINVSNETKKELSTNMVKIIDFHLSTFKKASLRDSKVQLKVNNFLFVNLWSIEWWIFPNCTNFYGGQCNCQISQESWLKLASTIFL